MDFFLINNQQLKQVNKGNKNDENGPRTNPQPVLTQNKQTTRTDLNDYTIKRGDNIKMVYKEKGSHNMYKGYIGEVKDYRKGQDYAMVILHAMNDMKLMKVSIDHFIKMDLLI